MSTEQEWNPIEHMRSEEEFAAYLAAAERINGRDVEFMQQAREAVSAARARWLPVE